MKIVFSFNSLKRGGFYTIFEADKELENISCQQFWEVVKKNADLWAFFAQYHT